MKKQWIALIAVCMVFAAFLSACGESSNKDKGTDTTSSSTAEINKYNAYIDFENHLAGWLQANVNAYANMFGLEEEMTFKKDFDKAKFKGAPTSPIVKGFFDQLDKLESYASSEPSFGAADETMKTLASKVRDFYNTMNEMDTYYRAKSYAEDDFAKGKELHKNFSAQYNAYIGATITLFKDMREITEKKEQEGLQELKDNDYLLRYYAKSIVMKAKGIQQDFIAAAIDDSNLGEYDAVKYKASYEALTEDITSFLDCAKDKERKKKEGIMDFWMFDQMLPRLKTSATDILQFLEKSPGGTQKNAGTPYGLIAQFESRLGEVINSYNNMIK
ncbi:DUF3829 domain-containing protein [Paenibacillus sp. GCM10027626]|uniref:DUF3829 domain-containing protein n=1 Tax=Paenibacillus sp. GCM10027626 TaxID=3273411 RepID=UPI0036393F1A